MLVVAGGRILHIRISVSRLARGFHDRSDVLGGMTEGVAYLARCLTAVETLQRRRRVRQTARMTPTDGVEG
jgi:hypothetical protein